MWSVDIILLVALLVVFFVVGAVTGGVIFYKVRWPMKYENYKEILPGQSVRTKKGRCRLVRFGDDGAKIYYLKGLGVYRASYGKQIDKNTIVWCEGQDGYPYNVTLQGVDKKLRQLGVSPIDRDARLVNIQIRKQIAHRYDDKTFIEKYGTVIMMVLLIIGIGVVGASNYFMWSKVKESRQLDADLAKTQLQVAEELKNVLAAQDRIKTGTSGYVVT